MVAAEGATSQVSLSEGAVGIGAVHLLDEPS